MAGFTPGDLLHQLGHQPLFIRPAEPRRHQHHDLVAISVGRDRSTPSSTTPYLDGIAAGRGAGGVGEFSHAATIGRATDADASCPQVVNDRVGASSRGYPQVPPQVWTCG